MSSKYTFNGIEVPSVTTVTGLVDSSDWKPRWAANCACDYVRDNLDRMDILPEVLQAARTAHEKISKQAKSIGSEAHDIIEKHIKDGFWNLSNVPEVNNAIDAFQEWEEQNIAKWIASEQPVYHPALLYGGTLDALAILKTGELALVDFKTSKGHYPGYDMQLAAYGDARPLLDGTTVECTSRFGEYTVTYEKLDRPITRYICLRIDKLTGQPDPKDYTKGISRAFDKFRAALDYWYLAADRRLKNNPRAAKIKKTYKEMK
jgi:hypothetical protein